METQTDTDKVTPNHTEIASLRNNPKVILVLVIVLLIYASAITVLYLLKLNERPATTLNTLPVRNSASSVSQSPTAKPQAIQQSNEVPDFSMVRIYPSLDRQFSFYIYPATADSSECYYGIRDREGILHDVSRPLGATKIGCSGGQGNILTDAYKGWADGNQLVIEKKSGEVTVLDVEKFTTQTINYDSNAYDLISAGRTLKYWLYFQKNKDGSYVLMDRNQKVVKDNLPATDRSVLYDETNDGFLFIKRNYTESKVSIKFDFLSLSDLSLRTILTSEPVEVPGRGCYSEYLLSKPGEIILTPGCLTVGENHIGPDGNIHIKL